MLKKISGILGKQQGQNANQIDYMEYAVAVEKTLTFLEAGVHESDDPAQIIQSAMRCACEFYQGDWVGFLEVDLELALWTPTVWYNANSNDKTMSLLSEFESSEFLHRWVRAMNENTPIIIEDMAEIKRCYPAEFEVLERLEVQTILAVPVKPRPTGFLVIRNPKRYITRSSMLQMLAFVILACVNEKNFMQSMKMSFSPDSIQHDTDVMIHLLGDMNIYTASGVLQEADMRSPLIWKLLAYMLITPKKVIPPRELIDALWPGEGLDYDSLGKNLRALIFRQRQAFGLISEYKLIESVSGGYCLNPNLHITTDFQKFDELWNAAQRAGSVCSRVELLKCAMDLYKGPLLDNSGDEHWLVPVCSYYHLCYLGVTNELLKTLAEEKDYHNLQKCAAASLVVEKGNPNTYYGLIYAMTHMGAHECAKTEIEIARQNLTDEDFQDLVVSLRDINPTDKIVHFRNQKIDS